MYVGIAILCIAYILSQFFRSFLAVLSSVLANDIGAQPDDLAYALGLLFLVFAVMQIPVGWGLDRFGPRIVSSVLLLIGGGGGAFLFASAQNPSHINLSMALLGVGCSPILMASYYIFARNYSPKIFATLAATFLGIGSLGTLIGASPLTYFVGILGWRDAVELIGIFTIFISLFLLFTVKNPDIKYESTVSSGGFWSILKSKDILLIAPIAIICYAPVAGLRGIWLGPYFEKKFEASIDEIGTIGLIMSLGMIFGTFFYGPLDRIFKTRKWIVLIGNFICLLSVAALSFLPELSYNFAIISFALVGFFGMSFPVVVAHGRSFVPMELSGRGVTLMNLFAIGGVGVLQALSGLVFERTGDFGAVFSVYFILILIGLVVYFWSKDNTS
ncbi:MAG: MFS transporter [Paracoccaceae bacterium]